MSSQTPSGTSGAATPTSTACTGAKLYQLPIDDAACGVPNTGNYSDLFSDCAQPVAVESYHNDCALYAPAVDQSVKDLTDCLFEAGVSWQDVWCSGETNATATATYPTATDESATGTGAESPDATGSDDEGSAASSLNKGSFGVKTLCLAMFVVLFSGVY